MTHPLCPINADTAKTVPLQWAAHGFAMTSGLANQTISSIGLRLWLQGKRDLWLFDFALAAIDVGFWFSKVQQCKSLPSACVPKRASLCSLACVASSGFVWFSTGKETGGVEEQLQRQFEKMAEDEFGVDLKEAKAFEG